MNESTPLSCGIPIFIEGETFREEKKRRKKKQLMVLCWALLLCLAVLSTSAGMEVEDDEKSKQLILWNVCNPFIGTLSSGSSDPGRDLLIPAALVPDTPFGLEVRSFTFVGRTLHFHQRPWVEGAKSIGAVLWDAVRTFSHFIYLFIIIYLLLLFIVHYSI